VATYPSLATQAWKKEQSKPKSKEEKGGRERQQASKLSTEEYDKIANCTYPCRNLFPFGAPAHTKREVPCKCTGGDIPAAQQKHDKLLIIKNFPSNKLYNS